MAKHLASLILFTLFAVFSVPSYARPQVKFQIHAVGSYDEVGRITALAKVAEKVVNSEEFEKRVKGAWTKYGKAFSYSNDSGAAVYDKMMAAAEFGGPADGVWDLDYTFEKKYPKCFGIGRWKKCGAMELGRTEGNKIYFNSVPWPGRDDCGIVGTIVHEQLHAYNYSHPWSNTRTRHLSVPYAIGNLAAELCPKFM